MLRSDIVDNHEAYSKEFGSFVDLGKVIKSNILNIYLLKETLSEMSYFFRGNAPLTLKRRSLSMYFDFMSYLRNLVSGHLDSQVIENAIKWEPSIFHVDLECCYDNQLSIFYKALMESAINSYTDQDGKHKIFSGEIDLFYTPNQKEFLDFLNETNTLSLQLIDSIVMVIKSEIKPVKGSDFFQLAADAGKVNFDIKKRK